MKKITTIGSLLLGVVFLSGCSSQQQASQTQPTTSTTVTQDSTTKQAQTNSKDTTTSGCGGQVKDSSGITYGTVLAEDGKCWLDRNLGATRVATSIKDKDAYGWLFQWGRGADGHQLPTSGTIDTQSSTDVPGNNNFIKGFDKDFDWRSSPNDNLWQGVNGINNPCPDGFRLPTSAEWASFITAAKIEFDEDVFESSLKLTSAGGRQYSNILTDGGGYWSSTPTSFQYSSNYFYFTTQMVYPTAIGSRASAHSVRCLKN